MRTTSPLSSVAPVLALGAALALQPFSLDLLTSKLRPAQAFAGGLGSRSGATGGSVGGSLGGSVGANLGASLGGTVGSASNALGGAAGLGVGAGASAMGAAAGSAGSALNGTAGVSVDGTVDSDVGAAASAAASSSVAPGSDQRGGPGLLRAIGALLKGQQVDARGHAQASARLAARYELAMLQGDIPEAALCLREMMPSQISTAAVDALDAQLSIEASARFVAALVQEARRQQRDDDASNHAGQSRRDKWAGDVEKSSQFAETSHLGLGSRDEAEAYGKAVAAGEVHAAAESYLRLAGAAASEAKLRGLNKELRLSVDEGITAKVAAETRLLARTRARAGLDGSASVSASADMQERLGLSSR